MNHECSSVCHPCPDLEGDIMPGCMGTAALSLDPTSFNWCTCESDLPTEASAATEVLILRSRVAQLEARLAELEART